MSYASTHLGWHGDVGVPDEITGALGLGRKRLPYITSIDITLGHIVKAF